MQQNLKKNKTILTNYKKIQYRDIKNRKKDQKRQEE